MAWVGEETFEGYTDENNLAGLSGGSGWSAAWVNSATNLEYADTASPYQGTVCARVNSNGGNTFYTRTLTTAESGSGVMYVALKKSSTSAGVNAFSLRSSVGGRVSIQLTAGGNLTAGSATLLAGYTANTWYVVRVTYDVGAGTYTAAYSTDAFGTGGTFGTESASQSMTSSGNIDRVGLGADTGANSWIDYISPTSPFTATTNISSIDGVARASISSFLGVASANIASVNGVTD